MNDRLEYLRGEIEAGRISYGEIAELQDLADQIDPGDTELLQWAGVPEFPEERAVEAVKAEILNDVRNGTVPATVGSFSELHDYVDANMYGDELVGKLSDQAAAASPNDPDAWIAPVARMQDDVDQWIKEGGITREI